MNIDELIAEAEKSLTSANTPPSRSDYNPDLQSGSIYSDLPIMVDIDADSQPIIDKNSDAVNSFLENINSEVNIIHSDADLTIAMESDDAGRNTLIESTSNNTLVIDTSFDFDEFLDYAQSEIAKAAPHVVVNDVDESLKANDLLEFELSTQSENAVPDAETVVSEVSVDVVAVQTVDEVVVAEATAEIVAAEVVAVENSNYAADLLNERFPALENATEPEQLIELSDAHQYQTTEGVVLDKFPKRLVKESTNNTKAIDWFLSQLLKLESEGAKSAINLIEELKSDASNVTYIRKAACQILFGNPFGPTELNRMLTKDEIKLNEEKAKKEKHDALVKSALDKLNDKASLEKSIAEQQWAGDIITNVMSHSAQEQAFKTFNETLVRATIKSTIDAAEKTIDNAEENQNQLIVREDSHDDSPSQEGSFYAIYKDGNVIATGEADKFPLKLLQSMAVATDGVLMWAAKPFTLNILQGMTAVQNLTLSDQSGANNEPNENKYNAEISKGIKSLKKTPYLKIDADAGDVVQQRAAEIAPTTVQEESNASSNAYDFNEVILERLTSLIDQNSARPKPLDLRLYANAQNINNVLVSLRSESGEMRFGSLTAAGTYTLRNDFDKQKLAKLIAQQKVIEISVDSVQLSKTASNSASPS